MNKQTDSQQSNNNVSTNGQSKLFFNAKTVEKGGNEALLSSIENKFQALINSRGEAPFTWYKKLDLDKSYASKVRRGVLIPPRWLRIRIASYFGVDSITIWNEKILLKTEVKKDNGNYS